MNEGFAHGGRAGAVLLLMILAVLALAAASSLAVLPSDSQPESEADSYGGDVRNSAAENGDERPYSSRPVTYEPDHILIRFESDASLAEVRASLSQSKCVSSSDVTDEDVEMGFARLALLPGHDVDGAMAEISPLDHVLDVQPNFVYGLAEAAVGSVSALEAASPFPQLSEINDPQAIDQWHLGEPEGVNAYAAWDMVRSDDGENPVTVAVLDTGCDVSHEDLADNIVATYDATASNWFNSGGSVRDLSGHGTHVCGLVSAVTCNGVGVSGVSYNAHLLPVRVFKGSETDSATLLRAYHYVMSVADNHNVRVVNMSLGGELEGYDEIDHALIDAVEEAYQAGILTVCAAGNGVVNDVPYKIFPLDYLEHAMGVIALEKDGQRASFSNFNISGERRTKDIAAPGARILSTWVGSQYLSISGTSMASPIVAGIAALVFSADPALSPGQVVEAIHATAVDLGEEGFDEQTGYGRVNAYAAVKQVLTSLEGAATVAVGASIELSPTTDGVWSWQSDNEAVATVDGGIVTGVSAGSAIIIATDGAVVASKAVTVYDSASSVRQENDEERQENEGYDDLNRRDASSSQSLDPIVEEAARATTAPPAGKASGGSARTSTSKKAQKIVVKTRVATVKASKLIKKVQLTCLVKVKGAHGKLSFKLAGGSKRLAVNGKTGKVTVKKGTGKGSYKVRVKIQAAATGTYKKSNTVSKVFVVKVTGS